MLVIPLLACRFKYWFGWGELWGIANRGSYDLENHSKASGIELNMQDVNNPKQVCVTEVLLLMHCPARSPARREGE